MTVASRPELVYSASVANNARVFAEVMRLHARPGSVVADLTFGLGVFWRLVPPGQYDVRASDLAVKADLLPPEWSGRVADGIDCRATPYAAGGLDCVVLDPPYMEGFYREGGGSVRPGSHAKTCRRYSAAVEQEQDGRTGYAAMLDLYLAAGREADRILKPGGRLVVKCQDAVASGRQRLTHCEIVAGYAALGLDVLDLFVVVRTNRPGVVRMKRQRHARKNHSYFVVFSKRTPRQVLTRAPNPVRRC